jgi:hypothetical protein
MKAISAARTAERHSAPYLNPRHSQDQNRLEALESGLARSLELLSTIVSATDCPKPHPTLGGHFD